MADVKSDVDLYDLISHRKVEALEAALKAGADPNQLDDYGQTPIFRVVYNPGMHQARMLELLLEHGADINHREALDGRTAIHNARSIQIAEILIRNGADLLITNASDATPLHRVESAEMAQFFIDRGLDVNAGDEGGTTPLFEAVHEGLELVDCLLKNGAVANLGNNKGHNALMWAVGDPFSDVDTIPELKRICDRLIESGADARAVDKDGKSAIDHARIAGNPDLANFLENKQS